MKRGGDQGFGGGGNSELCLVVLVVLVVHVVLVVLVVLVLLVLSQFSQIGITLRILAYPDATWSL